MDVLTDVLERTRARGSVFARGRFGAPWGLALTAQPGIHFHAVLEGLAWLRSPFLPAPLRLVSGDLVAVTAPGSYELLDTPGTSTVVPFARVLAAHAPLLRDTLRLGGDGPETALLCGAYQFDEWALNPLLGRLPPILVISAHTGPGAEAVQSAVSTLVDEHASGRPGAQTILDRMLDQLLVYLLRAWLESGGSPSGQWMQALVDQEIGKSLALVHAQPEVRWTVAQLAAAIGLSRAAFARRFTALVAESPMRYLTRWRMVRAAELLRDTTDAIPVIADRVGYDNPFAFSTAFKRAYHEPPGAYRIRWRRRGPERHATAVG